MKSKTKEDWEIFSNLVLKRLEKGEEEYGDRSFDQDTMVTLGELRDEALDLAGWGFILFQRIQSLIARGSSPRRKA